jgi:hypothetical protein
MSSLLCSALQKITISCARHRHFSCVTAAPAYLILLPNLFPITNYYSSLLPQFRWRRFFIFVLQFGEQVPSKYALGVSSSAPVLLPPTKYIWHDAYLFQPSQTHNLCPHDPPSIYSRSPKWLSFQRILHIAIMYAVPPRPSPVAAA